MLRVPFLLVNFLVIPVDSTQSFVDDLSSLNHRKPLGRSQNTIPIASTQVAIKGIVQYSTRAQFLVEQLATRHSREHTLSAVGPEMQVE